MGSSRNWDWTPGKKAVADFSQWPADFDIVEEPYVSPDGEQIAAVVVDSEGVYSVCVNGRTWTDAFDRIWSLRFSPDNRAVALVSEDAMWTVAVDGIAWENRFEYVWDLHFGSHGAPITVAAQNSRNYFAVTDNVPWPGGFHSLNHLTTAQDGRTVAAVVQTVAFKSADIAEFQKGCFTVAVNGKAWDRNFVNVWQMDISPDNHHVAAEARSTLYDYNIVVDGVAWPRSYPAVWRPRFHPIDNSVTAPVRQPDGWGLARDGHLIWNARYFQLWHHMYSPDGKHIAAIAAPDFGKWTIAEDDRAWRLTFNELVTDPVYSPDGRHIACVGKSDGKWYVAVDENVWPEACDRVWPPVFSPDGAHVAAKVEINGKFAIAVDGKRINPVFAAVWDPVFSPDGEKLLVRGIDADGPESGCYCRRVLTTDALFKKGAGRHV